MSGSGLLSPPSVVIVDDEPQAADLFAEQLGGENDVTVAYGGPEALDIIDHTTDVVLLDRRMPDMTGDEVLDHIRKQEFGCRVVMVTAVEPELDIVDLPFEEYLTKPVDADELRETINDQIIYTRYSEAVREYTRVRSKIDVLLDQEPERELIEDPDFQELCMAAHSIKAELEGLFEDHDESIPLDPPAE